MFGALVHLILVSTAMSLLRSRITAQIIKAVLGLEGDRWIDFQAPKLLQKNMHMTLNDNAPPICVARLPNILGVEITSKSMQRGWNMHECWTEQATRVPAGWIVAVEASPVLRGMKQWEEATVEIRGQGGEVHCLQEDGCQRARRVAADNDGGCCAHSRHVLALHSQCLLCQAHLASFTISVIFKFPFLIRHALFHLAVGLCSSVKSMSDS